MFKKNKLYKIMVTKLEVEIFFKGVLSSDSFLLFPMCCAAQAGQQG